MRRTSVDSGLAARTSTSIIRWPFQLERGRKGVCVWWPALNPGGIEGRHQSGRLRRRQCDSLRHGGVYDATYARIHGGNVTIKVQSLVKTTIVSYVPVVVVRHHSGTPLPNFAMGGPDRLLLTLIMTSWEDSDSLSLALRNTSESLDHHTSISHRSSWI